MTALTGGAVLALALVLGGCTPEPAPQPTPTSPFASEEEAFAAAEATYRAYVDALNQVDLSDPETFEPVFAWTTGEANAELRRSLSEMHANGWSVSGVSTVPLVQPTEADLEGAIVELAVCLDVASVAVVDESGESVVTEDRPPVQSMTVTTNASDSTPTGMAIALLAGREGEPSCT